MALYCAQLFRDMPEDVMLYQIKFPGLLALYFLTQVPPVPTYVLSQVALEAQEDFYRLMARGKLGQTGFRQWLRTSAYSIQQVGSH